MSEAIQFGLFTIFPFFMLAIASGVSAWKIVETDEYRLLLLVAVLLFMLSHQMLEGRTFFLTGSVANGLPEWLETTANTLASVAVYYGTTIFRRERELTTALEESEDRYRTLTEESPLPILVCQDMTAVYANEAMATLLGASQSDELVGRSLPEFFLAEDGASVRETVDAVVEDDPGTSFVEEELVGLDGTERTVLMAGGSTTYDDEPAVHLVFRDVTRERETQRELERTQGRLETTLESSNDAIFLIDPTNERIVDANPKAASMLKYDQDELEGLSPFAIHPHEESTFGRFLDRVFEEGGLRTEELSCLRKDGVEIPAEISASATTIGDEEYVLAAVRDISERKRKERQIQVLGRVLRHNLRNDMTVVMGRAGFIESETTNDEVGAAAESIHRKASDLVELSGRVRDLRSTIRGNAPEEGTVEVRQLVEGVVSEVREGYPNADITVDVPQGVELTGADPQPLAWALSNLVENAVEHNDTDRPAVWISVEPFEDRRGDWVTLSVADDGPPIPEHERTVATDPAEQTDLSHATGLGLWIVGQVVDSFDGDVTFEERETRGNVVNLHLRGSVGHSGTSAEAHLL